MTQTVKRPFMRTVPCLIVCRGDGKMVAAAFNVDPLHIDPETDAPCGYGMSLADALRDLADSIEREVEVIDVPQSAEAANQEASGYPLH